METVNWKVDGMDCSNCVLTIRQFLEKKGLQDVKVNLAGGDVSFIINGQNKKDEILKGIESLGYTVDAGDAQLNTNKKRFLKNHQERFLFCIIFTLPLLLHMFDRWIHIHWLMNPWIQMALATPVYIVGMDFFGKSAIKSIRNGMPNMNVLIAIGATAAYVYSLAGALLGLGEGYLFFETAASVITLVFLGNWMEDASIQSTQKSLNKLARSQKVMANMIAYDDQHQEHVFPVENTTLRVGDILLIKNGEQVPADCKILWGDATVNESIITGESMPIVKKPKEHLIGGSLLVDGTVKAYVTAEAKNSVLSNIIDLVKRAQGEKPPVQQMADKISAIFVPIVLGIAAVTLIANWIILQDFTASLMRSIAVLVIACPCAMGLATPAAIAVGLGRAARSGVLFRNAKSLELFRNIQQVVFDKTGTLTTGDFVIAAFEKTSNAISDEEFKQIVFSLEKYSNHPIAQCIAREWKQSQVIRWEKIEEVKGLGMKGRTKEGDTWQAGSYKIAQGLTSDAAHNVYIVKNDVLVGWIDVKDEVRPEAMTVVQYLRHKNIRTILLSGDRYDKCRQLADFLGIDEVIAEQTPQEKLGVVEDLTLKGPTAMVGDGINDAPALAKATVGISLSDASQVAMQTADVVLMDNGIKNLPLSLGLGRHTYMTIRQNLFWAFAYNIVAIPVAAFGLLTPTFGALVMGLSDVVLAINSGRLFVKKVV
ncbi:heavy metal translocating P-type ATPase [Pseudobacter ginsenosidimutans]|uniref:Cu+-exporting ATPase n=1 Tax=Pseudobacter ginsenosidimutans TaxID=661488 RepID=A0A4Q7MR17_9BACT|nr:cation-translocating P-type ATPase [Pseudobacter ginsenosidimutans]QEC41987.1 cadmium-translocating P-type ATPase [Pseudobacter ginsenosidimutans]RZS71186.1 Cu+-exporting ATPase [Pseudobacter ginsenosidimutans]